MKTLALCMIVKNEEELLGGCLESIKDWVDEMIVVDTGSTDNTKQIALEHGAKVFDFEWVNDFSAARNFSKAQTSCDYVIALDADERFNGENGPLLRAGLNKQRTKVGFVRLTNAPSINSNIEDVLSLDQEYTFLPRILKNEPGNDWVGRVHESPSDTLNSYYHKVDIVHLGADPQYREVKQKHERNWALLEQVYAEEPDQFPLFYSYLACERKLRGDEAGFFDILELGWQKHLELINTNREGVYNSGVLSTYPIVLIAKGDYEKGLEALSTLIKHINTFSANSANTLFQVLRALCVTTLPPQARDAIYQTMFEATDFMMSLKDVTFQEPTIKGIFQEHGLFIRAFCALKLKKFDITHEVLDTISEMPNTHYAVELMRIESFIEQGELAVAYQKCVDLLQDNLQATPDIWVLGAVLVLLLNEEETSKEYIGHAIRMMERNIPFVSNHRLQLLKGLSVRAAVLDGEPRTGPGVYGLIGAILSRTPVETVVDIPVDILHKVIERYVELGKVEKLLPFFDKRTDGHIAGCSGIVRSHLEGMGFVLEDDETRSPVILCGMDANQMLPFFDGHPDFELIAFSDIEQSEIQDDLSQHEDLFLDDLLFGTMDDLGDKEESKVKVLLSQKLSDSKKTPVFIWNEAWPVDCINDVFEDSFPVFFLSNPLNHAVNSEELHNWHLQNHQMFTSIRNWSYSCTVKTIQTQPKVMYSHLMASIGAYIPTNVQPKLDVDCGWNSDAIRQTFTGEKDTEIMKLWQLL